MAIFAALVRVAGFGPLQIFPALLWVPLEFLFPLLFPWYVANSQVAFSWFIQSADLVGPYGASFIVMWFNAAVYNAAFAPQRERLGVVASGCLRGIGGDRVAWSTATSASRASAEEMAGARKLTVASVQANIDVDLKWNPALIKQNLEKHMSLTEQLDAVPLVIWPESAVELWVPERIQVLPRELTPPLKSERANFIFGARSFRGTPGTANFKAFNTAFIADAQGPRARPLS